MHELNALLADGNDAVRRLKRRGFTLDLTALRAASDRRREWIQLLDKLRAEAKQVASEVQQRSRSGGEVEAHKEHARELKARITEASADLTAVEAQLRDILLTIPNLPLDECPDGFDDESARQIRTWAEIPNFTFTPRDHVELAEGLGLFDFARASKLSGPRFVIGRGVGAKLERALANFLLDLHTEQHGYQECSVPHLVNQVTMTGTGQLPKFEEDLFKTHVGDRDLYLIPTGEVPLTNFYAGEILPRDQLPIALTAQSPCYRSEAGSYGRDARGLIRLHQFSKVEMVRVCDPTDALDQLDLMVSHAENCLQQLGLAYRVVVLAAGDTGFSSEITYDLEVWLPGQGRYREISSCSSCATFQARRANIRMRKADGERQFVATLNGSGLPVGRTVAAILEQNQREDGSVDMPKALVPYLGFSRVNADGTTS